MASIEERLATIETMIKGIKNETVPDLREDIKALNSKLWAVALLLVGAVANYFLERFDRPAPSDAAVKVAQVCVTACRDLFAIVTVHPLGILTAVVESIQL